jgi:hypothetical protein
MDAAQIGKRAWSYAGVLQDAGLSCFEYVEQLTPLLFLKMANQLTRPPHDKRPIVPHEQAGARRCRSTARRSKPSTARSSKHWAAGPACSA